MGNRTSRRGVLGVLGVLAVLAAFLAFAVATTVTAAQGTSSHATTLTFSKAVRLPGVQLNAGSYVFEVTAPVHGIVRVLSADHRTSYFQGYTESVPRPDGLARHGATARLREAAAGEAPAVEAWWAEGESRGHAFIY